MCVPIGRRSHVRITPFSDNDAKGFDAPCSVGFDPCRREDVVRSFAGDETSSEVWLTFLASRYRKYYLLWDDRGTRRIVSDSWTSKIERGNVTSFANVYVVRASARTENTKGFFAIVRRLHVRSYDIYTIIDRFGELVCQQGCGSNRVKNENYIVARSRCLSAVPYHWYHSW